MSRWDAMMVEEYVDKQGQGRSKWTKIGAAFQNKDGSIGIQLNAMPINGKVILQVPLTQEEREAKFGPKQQGGRQQQQGGRRQQTQPTQGGFNNYAGRGRAPAPAQHPNAGGDDGGFADDEGPPSTLTHLERAADDEIPF